MHMHSLHCRLLRSQLTPKTVERDEVSYVVDACEHMVESACNCSPSFSKQWLDMNVMLAYVHVSHSCTPLDLSERKHIRHKVNNMLTVVLCSASPSLNFGRHCVRCKLTQLLTACLFIACQSLALPTRLPVIKINGNVNVLFMLHLARSLNHVSFNACFFLENVKVFPCKSQLDHLTFFLNSARKSHVRRSAKCNCQLRQLTFLKYFTNKKTEHKYRL